MISQKMQDAINEQINAELYSAYLYLSMSADLEEKGLGGFANWMRAQAQEEEFHAMKFYGYVVERGGRVILDTIKKPRGEWSTVKEIFEETLKHEEHVTGLINKLMDMAIEEKDHASVQFLQWYVEEQVEEEANAGELLDKLTLIDGKGQGLLMMDKELSTRSFTPPATEEV